MPSCPAPRVGSPHNAHAAMQAIKKEVDTAVEQAKASSIPKPEALWQNIYKDGLSASFRGLDSKTFITL